MKLKELQEKRKKLGQQIRQMGEKFNANGKKWSDASEAENWRKLNADYDATMQEFRTEQATVEVDQRMSRLTEDDEGSTERGRKPGMDDTDPDERSGGSGEREERGSRAERRERRRQSNRLPSEETRTQAMNAWARSSVSGSQREDREAMRACGFSESRRGFEVYQPDSAWVRKLQRTFRAGNHQQARERCENSEELRTSLDSWYEKRAMSSNTAATGGLLVPASFIRQCEINMLAFGGMFQVATIQRTATGELMTMPTADDTSNTGAMIGENTSVGSSVEPSFGGVQWTAYKFHSKPVLVPHELLEDATVDVSSLLAEMLPERIARKQNTMFTTGSGGNQPKGIVTCAAAGRTATNATSITYDDIIYLEHSIDASYRTDCEFMCHDNIVLAIRLLKDSNGRYLWTYGVDAGQPDTLDGKRLTVNQDMASAMASGAKTLLYGQLKKYIIRQAGLARFYRLTERYRDTDQDGFMMFQRADGNLLHSGTVPVKYMVHP